jgi:glutathione S-transferase
VKLYNSIGPNPKTVRMFMAEKGIELPRVEIDIRGGENRQGAFVSKNPAGQTPALELDDGTVLSEITAICEYLDEVSPGPSLIGATPQERATTRMWVRRIDLNIVEPMANGFRYGEGLRMFEHRMRCIPHAAADLKLIAQDKLAWLDGLIAGRDFICGNTLTLADILLFAFLEFGATVGQPVNLELGNITAWFARMKGRPSAVA